MKIMSKSVREEVHDTFIKRKHVFKCIICLVEYKHRISYGTTLCSHEICRDCLNQYIQSILTVDKYNQYETILCPAPLCPGHFDSNAIMAQVLSKAEAEEWWVNAITKQYITNRVLCPQVDCSGVFDADINDMKHCIFTECYECHRGFCLACQKSWHPGEIRIYNDEVAMQQTLNKAQNEAWCRCPRCHALVEKMTGCITVQCRCGTSFCYRCGGYSNNHSCSNQCQRYDQNKLKQVRSPMFVHNSGSVQNTSERFS
ncbi:hypothetical protein BDB01DRAFT_808183 [Pilobolus umbonatus]|nr:hypothetical protein BDB01DRAFT_808183 [Pilobolus umbonatus]